MDRSKLISDYSQAVLQLEEVLAGQVESKLEKAGCIQYFEFSFELAWKLIKQIASEHGIDSCVSPKSSLKYAFKAGWLKDEELWLDMLASRNKMSHTYNAEEALQVYDKLAGYLLGLRQLEIALSNVD